MHLRLARRAGSAACLLLVTSALSAAELAGTTTGKFNVSALGGAEYSIPVTVAPGAGGLEPALRIQYSSNAGYGHMGYGSTLTGLSQITRCPATLEPEGFIDPIDYDSNDRYCLDGQKLIAVAGVYGQQNTEYRTENETFSKVSSVAGGIGDPSYFVVKTKSGLTYELGTTEDSRFEPPGSNGKARTWGVKTIRDTSNNYMTFQYNTDDQSTGEFYPLSIQYTGNSVAGISPMSSVVFEWELLPISVTTYSGGARSIQARRLKVIRTKFGSSTIRTYTASYEESVATARSRLASVQECAASGDCFPATQLDWQDATSVTSPFNGAGSGTWSNTGLNPEAPFYNGDFDGDGKTDVAQSTGSGWRVCLARQTTFSCSTGSGPPEPGGEHNLQTGDFDGDGKTDLVDIYINGTLFLSVYRFNGSGFTYQNWGGFEGNYLANRAIVTGDYNGDGRADVLHEDVNDAYIFFSTGSGFSAGSWSFNRDIDVKQSQAGDFNGDGRTDFMQLLPSDGLIEICYATGTAFSCSYQSLPYQGEPMVADFNGDSLHDFAIHPGATTIWYLCISTGAGFACQTTSAHSANQGNNFLGDFDGNGMTDLATIVPGSFVGQGDTTATWEVCLSRGTTFTCGNRSVDYAGPSAPYIGDFNGDGLADIASTHSSGAKVALGSSPKPDVLTRITNGLGAEVRVEYRSLADAAFYQRSTYFSYPVRGLTVPVHVVSANSSSNGLGSLRRVSHVYEDARIHVRGRGFLGFARRSSFDETTRLREVTDYEQGVPLVGLPKRVRLETESASLISDTSITNQFQTHGSGGSTRYFSFAGVITERKYELAPFFHLVATTITSNTYGDAYGNLTALSKNVYAGSEATGLAFATSTVNTFLPADVANWRLGRLERAQVTRQTPTAPAITRTSNFEYHSGTGLLSAEIVEQGTTLELRRAYQRDAFGNITLTTTSGPDIATRAASTEYDTGAPYYGRFATKSINALLHSESRTFDAGTGAVTSVLDPNGLLRTFTQDSLGRATGEFFNQQGINRWTRTDRLWCWQTSVCETGDVLVVRTYDAGGGEALATFDAVERQAKSITLGPDGSYIEIRTEYDAEGNVTRKSSPKFRNGSTTYWTNYSYDSIGRVVEQNAPIDADSPSGRIARFEFNGLITNQYDGLNRRTTRERDPLGNLVSVTDARNGSVISTYDAYDNLLTSRDAGNAVTAMYYDVRGRKRRMIDPNMGEWTYDYNVLGELTRQTDAKLQVMQMEYDVLGRMKRRLEPEGETLWTYDSVWKGALTQVAGPDAGDGADYVRRYTYHPHGAIEQEIVSVKSEIAPPGWGAIEWFTASPVSLSEGQTTNLSWSTTETLSCSGSGSLPGWAGGKSTNGSQAFKINVAGSYEARLTCSDAAGGSVTKSVNISVSASPRVAINYFYANPQEFDERQSTTISWGTSNAAYCQGSGTLPGWTGNKASSGNQALTVNEHGEYEGTLACWDVADRLATSSLSVKVNDCVLPLLVCVNPPDLPADPIGDVMETICNTLPQACTQPPPVIDEALAAILEIVCHEVTCSKTPGWIEFASASQAASEPSGEVPVFVNRSGGVMGAAAVSWSIDAQNSTAMPGTDHTAAGGVLVWADGDGAQKVIMVPIANDDTVEPSEHLQLKVHAATGAALGGRTTTRLDVSDDDTTSTPSTLQFTGPSQQVSESSAQAVIFVERTGDASESHSMRYSAKVESGTATVGADYQPVTGVVTWGPGEGGVKSFTVPLLDDTTPEPQESFVMQLDLGVGSGQSGTYTAHTVYVSDDDAPLTPSTAQFTSSGQVIAESALQAVVWVGRSGNAGEAQSVRYSAEGGSAKIGADFGPVSGVLAWAPGESGAKSFTVPIVDDTEAEAQENFGVRLDLVVGGLGGTTTHTVYIDDNDSAGSPGTIQFSSTAQYVTEASITAQIRVQRVGGAKGAATAQWQVGDVTAGPTDHGGVAGVVAWTDGDYADKVIQIPIVDDPIDEPTESFAIVIGVVSGGPSRGSIASTTLYISDNDAPLPPINPPPIDPPPIDPRKTIEDLIESICELSVVCSMIPALPSDPVALIDEICRYSGLCDRLPDLDAAPSVGPGAAVATSTPTPVGDTQGGGSATSMSESSSSYLEFAHRYDYDGLGRVSRITYPSGFRVDHAYTATGALEKVFDPTLPNLPYWKAVGWDHWGNAHRTSLRNGVDTLRSFDAAVGQLDSTMTGTLGGSNVQSLNFGWDVVGNLTHRADNNQAGLREDFEYDELRRLTRSTLTGVPGFPGALENLRVTYQGNGNIETKTGVGTYQYGARPHAVSSIGSATYAYDANGNMETGGTRTYDWSSYNLPLHAADGGNSSEFMYGPERQKARHRILTPEGGKLVYYASSLYEEHHRGSTVERKHYISTPQGVVAIETWWGSASVKREYLHEDHLGSTDVITGDAGQVIERMSFDAFGKRRGLSWQGSSTQQRFVTAMGFTGHEQLDHLGLIHMNGRVYDPAVGRFISADPFIQAPDNTQSHNRYSYVMNNPLSMTDPSGFFSFQEFGMTILQIGLAFAAAALSVLCLPCGMALAAFGAYALSGGDWNAALVAAASVGLFHGLGTTSIGQATYAAPMKFIARTVISGTIGGLASWAMGGTFRDGFLAAGAATLATPMLNADWFPDSDYLRTAAASVIGGTAAVLGGGKFANGAITASFAYLLGRQVEKANEQGAAQQSNGNFFIEFAEPGTTTDPVYDQVVTLYDQNGNVIGFYQGSSSPNPYDPRNPTVGYPTVQEGAYPVTHGQHKGAPALVVNGDRLVPTTGPNPRFPAQGENASLIRIHSGWTATWRGSAGCFTINPSQWKAFLSAVPAGSGYVAVP